MVPGWLTDRQMTTSNTRWKTTDLSMLAERMVGVSQVGNNKRVRRVLGVSIKVVDQGRKKG